MRCNGKRLGSRSKFRQAYSRGREVLPQMQTKVPEPLIHDLPELLTTRRVRTPTIRLLFAIFIGENGLKRAPMQIQAKHIRTGESRLWCRSEKQLVHRPISQDADRSLGGGSS